ncbi:MAG: hypothetical protein U9N30_06705 [Campylobacterota bacterium]|nr:hypothetical protein [Campylobacterota bacterium]
MAVKFISHVDQHEDGSWFIKLTDTLEEKDVLCKNLDEYTEQIEELGAAYGGEIEVVWTRSNLLSPANTQDIQEKMAVLQEKYQDEIDKINNNKDNQDQGFNPNA